MRRPTEEESRKMTAKAVEIGIKAVMENNVYQFAEEVRLQKDDGGFGIELTGHLAKGVMVTWDQKFRRRLEELVVGILMYKRYIDDMNMVMEAVGRVMRYNKERRCLEEVEEGAELEEEASDKRMFEMIR